MNDRFKFRVWDKVSKRYFYLELKFGDNGYNPSFITDPVFEQCTGLSDKNGNLIYEGDKVEITIFGSIGPNGGYVDSDTQYQGVVVWAKQGFYVKVVDNFFYIPEDPEDVEIVGNIHENKGE